MGQHASEAIQQQAMPVALPPLEGGDHLTRHEFERRYQARPDIKKAELIEGVVYMPSPVRAKSHGVPHGQIMAWLGVYYAATPGVEIYDNATLRRDLENEVQPDALLRLEPGAGGHSHITEDDYIEGAPELIVEVAAS
ncbi:MAG TPA: Uma2 family endonuclease, partial [Candidatus Binatia bacterium]|nr:Uma2 family endonuclease [Candidatus Binatia bacterium]